MDAVSESEAKEWAFHSEGAPEVALTPDKAWLWEGWVWEFGGGVDAFRWSCCTQHGQGLERRWATSKGNKTKNPEACDGCKHPSLPLIAHMSAFSESKTNSCLLQQPRPLQGNDHTSYANPMTHQTPLPQNALT